MIHLRVDSTDRRMSPFKVTFSLPESAPVSSMLDEGFVYRRPERYMEVLVWAKDRSDVAGVLSYHYGNQPQNVVIS